MSKKCPNKFEIVNHTKWMGHMYTDIFHMCTYSYSAIAIAQQSEFEHHMATSYQEGWHRCTYTTSFSIRSTNPMTMGL